MLDTAKKQTGTVTSTLYGFFILISWSSRSTLCELDFSSQTLTTAREWTGLSRTIITLLRNSVTWRSEGKKGQRFREKYVGRVSLTFRGKILKNKLSDLAVSLGSVLCRI